MAIKFRKIKDIGFGEKGSAISSRLIKKDGKFNVERQGIKIPNLYAYFLEITWTKFYLFILAFYIVFNILFAFLITLMGHGAISGSVEPSWWERFLHCFFFSIQTFTTVGYGSMSPETIPANILSAIIALIGLLVFALMTGLFFARLSKPVAFISFSEKVLLAPFNGGLGLMFRMVNTRDTVLSDVKINVMLSWLNFEGTEERREYFPLELERDSINLFPLNWTIVHPIDEMSPLTNISIEELSKRQAEILVDFKGYDETFNQTVRIRNSYMLEHIITGQKFSKMYHTSPKGIIVIEIDNLDATEATH